MTRHFTRRSALTIVAGASASVAMGRAWAAEGDTTQARKAYQNFFAMEQDADADLPALVQAKQEFAALK